MELTCEVLLQGCAGDDEVSVKSRVCVYKQSFPLEFHLPMSSFEAVAFFKTFSTSVWGDFWV
jgi:hypothetical protein